MGEQKQEVSGLLACILERWTRNAQFYPSPRPAVLTYRSSKLATQATGSSLFQTIFPILRFLGVYSRVDTAAYTSLYAVASNEFTQKLSGEYLRPVAKLGKASKQANDAVLAKDLWEWTAAEMTKLNLIPP